MSPQPITRSSMSWNVPRRHTAVVAVLVLVLAALTGLTGTGAATAQADCADVRFFGLRGSGETPPTPDEVNNATPAELEEMGRGTRSMGQVVATTYQHFDIASRRFGLTTDAEGIPYPAVPIDLSEISAALSDKKITKLVKEYYETREELAYSVTYGAVKLNGRLELQAAACPDQQFVIVAYSQGAWAVQDALRLLDKSTMRRIKGIVLYASPLFTDKDKWRAGDFSIAQPSQNVHGLISGKQLPSDIPARTYCKADDFVCAASPGNAPAVLACDDAPPTCPHMGYWVYPQSAGEWLANVFAFSDLTVTDLTGPEGKICAGDTVQVRAAIRNVGRTVSGPFAFHWILDGEVINVYENSLDPGQAVNRVLQPPPLTSGAHRVELVIDSAGVLTELSEDNNAQDIRLKAKSCPGPRPPRITQVDTYTEGPLIYLRVFYTDPDNDAQGFGFRGANGSEWAQETHPFTDPSYGRVGPGRIDYPFNHGCGTTEETESDVEMWIYDATGSRSQSVIRHLACPM